MKRTLARNLSPMPAAVAAVLLALTVPVGAAFAQVASISGATTVTLNVGATVVHQNLQIEFLKVDSDSRCPIGTTCVAAGNAAVQLRASVLTTAPSDGTRPKSGSVINLNSTTSPLASVGEWRISFVSLLPAPTAKLPTPEPGAYKLNLKLDKITATTVTKVAAPVAPINTTSPTVTGTTTTTTTTAPLQTSTTAPATLSLAQGGSMAYQNLNIAFVSVLEDSRCPTGVNCATAGNAKVRIQVSGPGVTPSPTTLDLNSAKAPTSGVAGGVTISVVSLLPLPSAAGSMASGYKLTLGVKPASVVTP